MSNLMICVMWSEPNCAHTTFNLHSSATGEEWNECPGRGICTCSGDVALPCRPNPCSGFWGARHDDPHCNFPRCGYCHYYTLYSSPLAELRRIHGMHNHAGTHPSPFFHSCPALLLRFSHRQSCSASHGPPVHMLLCRTTCAAAVIFSVSECMCVCVCADLLRICGGQWKHHTGGPLSTCTVHVCASASVCTLGTSSVRRAAVAKKNTPLGLQCKRGGAHNCRWNGCCKGMEEQHCAQYTDRCGTPFDYRTLCGLGGMTPKSDWLQTVFQALAFDTQVHWATPSQHLSRCSWAPLSGA